jgi:hypothetical protein
VILEPRNRMQCAGEWKQGLRAGLSLLLDAPKCSMQKWLHRF